VIQRICLLFLCLFCTPNLLAAPETGLRDQIRQRIELIRSGNGLTIDGDSIASVQVLPALYEQNDYAAVWSRADSINQLFEALETIDGDGLDAADYHYAALSGLRAQVVGAGTGDPALSAPLITTFY